MQESEIEKHENNFHQQPDTSEETVTKDHQVSGMTIREPSERHTGNPEAKPDISKQTNEIKTPNGSSIKDFSFETKSVSSQTDESLYLVRTPASPELHCVHTQTEEEEGEDMVDSLSVSPVPLSENAGSGDRMLFSGSFPIPADPARLAERIRHNRTQLSAAFDDTEYEPYGLPEVVMKGNHP